VQASYPTATGFARHFLHHGADVEVGRKVIVGQVAAVMITILSSIVAIRGPEAVDHGEAGYITQI
jgi:hypothetical protein